MEQINLNGRTMLVTPVVADRFRKAQIRERDKARRLSRELKEARLLPDSKSGIPSAHSSYTAPAPELNNRVVWQVEKKLVIEDNWTKHLQTCGL